MAHHVFGLIVSLESSVTEPSQVFLPVAARVVFWVWYPGMKRSTMDQNSGVWFPSR